MKEALPLGQPEAQDLKFLPVAALHGPDAVAREVVAMLNATGGTVWVGLFEDQGRATRAQPLPQGARQRLADHLAIAVEPTPSVTELDLVEVALQHGSVLAIVARPDRARGPYAQVGRGCRAYVTRVGSSVRPMSREELARAFHDGETARGEATGWASARLLQARDAAVEPGLWLGACFAPEARIGLEASRPLLVPLLQEAELTGNRIGGYHFANPYRSPAINPDGLSLGQRAEDRDALWIGPDGTLQLWIGRERLRRSLGRPAGAEPTIHAMLLIEYTASIFRLLGALLRQGLVELPSDASVLVDLALRGFLGWRLGQDFALPAAIQLQPWEGRVAHDAGTTPYGAATPFNVAPPRLAQRDVLFESPLALPADELRRSPDRCAFLLLRRVYQAFQQPEEAITFYRREAERFVFEH